MFLQNIFRNFFKLFEITWSPELNFRMIPENTQMLQRRSKHNFEHSFLGKKCRPIIETCRLKFRFYGIQITDSRNINFFRFWTLLTVQVLNSEFKFESSVKIYPEKWSFNAVLALLRPYFRIKGRNSDFEKQPFLPFWPFSSTKCLNAKF